MGQLQLTGERQITPELDKIKPDHRQRYEWAAEYINDLYPEAIVLDAACGVGYGSFVMGSAGLHVLGVDIEQAALDVGMAHYAVPDKVVYEQCDLMSDELPSFDNRDMYDVIVSFETIEHVKDDHILLERFNKLGKWLILSVPNQDVIPYDHALYPFHFRHYTPLELELLLVKTGWEPVLWMTQYDKSPGTVYEADDGRTTIVACVNSNSEFLL